MEENRRVWYRGLRLNEYHCFLRKKSISLKQEHHISAVSNQINDQHKGSEH